MSVKNLRSPVFHRRRGSVAVSFLVACGILFQTFVLVGHGLTAPAPEEQSLLSALKQICRAIPLDEENAPAAPIWPADPSCLVCQVASMVAVVATGTGHFAPPTIFEDYIFPQYNSTISDWAFLRYGARGPPILHV